MKLEFSIDIPAPRRRVWEIAQNPDLRPEWDPRVARYSVPTGPGPEAPIEITIRLFGARPVLEGRYVRFDPPVQSAVKLDRSSSRWVMVGGGTWQFDEIPGGTRMTTRFTLKPDDRHGPPPLPGWMIRWGIARDTRKALKRLRRLVAKLG